jgi:hypothetical protein
MAPRSTTRESRMNRLHRLFRIATSALALAAAAEAKSICVNFTPIAGDGVDVDADESSVTGIAGAETVAGTGWNNIRTRNAGSSGDPAVFRGQTQGGNHIDLIGSDGADSGVDLTSAGTFFFNFSQVSNPSQAVTGDGGMMQSYLLANASETISLSGLAAWAPDGYRVIAFFDIGDQGPRVYGLKGSDGIATRSFFTNDSDSNSSGGVDTDPNNDGIIEWQPTAAASAGAAVADANYADFGTFTGDTFTLSGADANRAVISGFQVIPITGPLATIVSFTATPATFTAGETVTLAWEVNGADSVSIGPGVGTVAASGTLELKPSATTTWTLAATSGANSTTRQATAKLGLGPIDVYLLGGQSNMQGTARSSKLPAGLLSIPGIRLYTAGSGVNGAIANQWVGLQPANGSSFGPEIGIGERMLDLCPGKAIALIKYAASGTSLEIGWKPGANAADTGNWGPEFNAFVRTVNNGLTALETQGWQPVIRGMCWFQGEQDAKDGLDVPESNTSADDYGANLAHLIARVRQQFAAHAAAEGIRFVPGQVLPYAPPGGDVATRFPGRDLVRQGILAIDEESGAPVSVANTKSVATNATEHPTHAQDNDGYRDADEVHLNATALLALGRAMAYGMLDLEPVSYVDWADSFGLAGGPDDDDDFDGLANRLEYLFGGHPVDAADAPRPRLGTVDHEGDRMPAFTLVRDLGAADVSPEVAFSTDLADWASHPPVLVSSVKQADGTAVVTYRGPWALNDPARPRGFFRTRAANP